MLFIVEYENEDELKSALEERLKDLRERKQRKSTELSIEFPNRKVKISVEKILYIESKLHQIFCYVMEENGEVVSYAKYGKLSDLEQELLPLGFCRTHQSYLVNMNFVIKVERYEMTLQGDIRINISKKYYKDIEMKFLKAR